MNRNSVNLKFKTSNNSYKRIISLILVTVMLAGMLPGGLISLSTNVNAAPDPTWTPNTAQGEVLITTQADLHYALTGTGARTINGHAFTNPNQITKIYLGADITFNSGDYLRGRSELIIDGVNPVTGTRHTLTFARVFYENTASGNGGIIGSITFKNINLRQPSTDVGLVRANSASASNSITVTFNNTDILVHRVIFPSNMGNCKLVIIDSDIVSKPTTGRASGARLMYCGRADLYGEITITSNQNTYALFQMYTSTLLNLIIV